MKEKQHLHRSRWITDDQRFIFDFEIDLNKNNSPYIVYVSLKYESPNQNERLILNYFELFVDNEEKEFCNSYKGTNDYIKGTLKAFLENNDTELIVYGDFDHGQKEPPDHFSGPMWVEKINIPYPPLHPEPIINTNTENIAPIIVPDTYHDLFPFIYLNNWPAYDEQEYKFSFVVYEPLNTSPPANSFFNKLSILKKDDDRNGMEEEAVKLIENDDLYKDIFITNVEDLTGEIALFPLILIDIKNLENYDSIILFICEFFDISVNAFYNYLKSQNYILQKEKLWQSYFALFIRLGYRFKWLDQISTILTACHLLEEIFFNITEEYSKNPFSDKEVKELIRASIILPDQIFPMPPYLSSPPVEISNSWVEPYALGSLQLVKQKLLRYEAGEIASIISVMPGEKKQNTKRTLHQETEKNEKIELQENIQIQNTEEQNDDLANEVIKTLVHSKDIFTYHDYKTNYGPPTSLTLDGSYDIEKTVIDPGQVKASLFAKKIINASSGSISKKVSHQRMSQVNNEMEETSVSTFDNTGNNKAIYGTYHWLNKVYEARLVNYGNRLMLSFLISNPAEQYIKAEFNFNNEKLIEPKSPKAVFDISTFEDITIENYLSICVYYDVENFSFPPDDKKIITGILEGNESKILNIPEGYEADTAFVTYISNSDEYLWKVNGFVGRVSFDFVSSSGISDSLKLSKENLTIPISATCNNMCLSPPVSIKSFRINIEIECNCCDRYMQEWKKKIYTQIMNNYKEQRNSYFNELNTGISNDKYSNPLYVRNTIRKELKKSCIKQLINNMIETKGLSAKHVQGSPTVFEVNKPQFLSFLNNAIEWNEMTYSLLEDFGVVVDYTNMVDVTAGEDDVFTAFLQAEGARIIVPVKPEFNHSILFFLKTGSVWIGRDLLVPVLKDQVSLISELKHLYSRSVTNEKIIECWEFKVPTSLQILRNNNFHGVACI